ncbi:hypothetical protein SDC9_152236 [bioreactor metagenome]|uniref:Uncharacterized protein n=1 Tax=bioreactor metagenome TaxID=1076179 RepID=A0A645ET24_9ZZZZ
MFQPDCSSLRPVYLHSGYPRHVLPEIVEPGVLVNFFQTYRTVFPDIADRVQCLCHYIVGRCSCGVNVSPALRVEIRSVPSGLFFSGIVMFGRVYTVKDYRTL